MSQRLQFQLPVKYKNSFIIFSHVLMVQVNWIHLFKWQGVFDITSHDKGLLLTGRRSDDFPNIKTISDKWKLLSCLSWDIAVFKQVLVCMSDGKYNTTIETASTFNSQIPCNSSSVRVMSFLSKVVFFHSTIILSFHEACIHNVPHKIMYQKENSYKNEKGR